MMKAVFFDRDGVINEAIVKSGKPYPPNSLDTLRIFSGIDAVLKLLKEAGFLLIVVTNQPDVSRGKTSKTKVNEINNFLLERLPIDEIITCFHDDCDNCNCRKPKPGAILTMAKKYNLNLSECYMIGDRWRDIEAGLAAGCKTIFINYNYLEKNPIKFDFEIKKVYDILKIILGKKQWKN